MCQCARKWHFVGHKVLQKYGKNNLLPENVPFASTLTHCRAQVLGQMTYPVASLTPDSARLGDHSTRIELIGVPVGPVFLLELLTLAIVTACVSRAAAMPSFNQLLDGKPKIQRKFWNLRLPEINMEIME
ncbi:hypothetical protein Tco_0705352 [Tanacetum coccineum]|uniref:Uncharacterized protein n=1 Tax=Tanacetum coccineum TaxID=301880 RepID=A0ABQ4Y5R2_9ASTR